MKNNWPIKKLGEVVIHSVNTPKIKKNDYKNTGKFPIIDQSQSFIAGYTDTEKYLYFGDLPVIIFGDHTQVIKYIDKPFARGADGTKVITADANQIDTKFLFYTMSNLKLESHGYSRHYQYLVKTELTIPPLKAQKKIVERLDAIRKAQEICDQQIQKTEELFDSLIFKELEKLNIETQTLGKVCNFQYGYTHSASEIGKYRFIRITDINDYGEIRNNDAKFISDNLTILKPYILTKADLLVARTGATYGKVLLFDLDQPSVFASFLIRIIPDKTKILPKFIWLFSRSKTYWEQAERLVSGTGQPQFNANKLKEIKIKIPRLKTQQEIIEKLEAVQNYKKILQKEKTLLKELFDSVLDKSMKGEMD